MSNSNTARGIGNGHWESSESRTGWLLMLARMGAFELRVIGDIARSAVANRTERERPQLARVDEEAPIAAE